MGRSPHEGVDAVELAKHVGADVRSAEELTTRTKLEELDALQPGAFSACTFKVRGQYVIVYSPLCSPGRTQSDVAHEVAHLLLEHELKTVQNLGGLSFFTCDSVEEQEANWLAGCLLLPRPLLLAAARRGWPAPTIAAEFNVSEQMAAFRLRATGVQRQLAATRRRG
jgi:Zn-dependent peptidase ImmA (M78 family)